MEPTLQAIFDFLHDDVACMPLYHNPSIWAHGERVVGFQAPSTEYDMPFENISLGT